MDLWTQYFRYNFIQMDKITITGKLISRYLLHYERFDIYEVIKLIDGGWLS